MGCGQSKHEDVAAGNTIARKMSSIRNSWRSNKDAAVESVKEESQKNVTVDDGHADEKAKEGGNVRETDRAAEKADAVSGKTDAEEKKAGPATEEVKTEGAVAVAAPENVKVEETKEEKAVAVEKEETKKPVEETKEKESPVTVKLEEKREEAGKGEAEEKEAPVVKVEAIKEKAKVGNGAEERVNAAEIKQNPAPAVENVKVEETKVAGKDVEEASGAVTKVEVEEKIAEQDVKENQNVGVEEKATPVIPNVEVKEQAETAKSENFDKKQQEEQPKAEKATEDETTGFSTPAGEEKLNIEKVEAKSGEETAGEEEREGVEIQMSKEEDKTA